MSLQLILLTILQIGLLTQGLVDAQTDEEMIAYLTEYDEEAKLLCNKNVHASWNVQTDVMNTSLVADQVRVKVPLMTCQATCGRWNLITSYRRRQIGVFATKTIKVNR